MGWGLDKEGEMGCRLEREGEMGCRVERAASGSGQNDDVDVDVEVHVDVEVEVEVEVEVTEGESEGGGMWPLSRFVMWALMRASSVGWYSWLEYKSGFGEICIGLDIFRVRKVSGEEVVEEVVYWRMLYREELVGV